MNSTAHDTSSSVDPTDRRASSPELVQVVLDTCSVADADTVLRVLGTRFAPESGDETPRHDSTAPSDTWTGAFLVGRDARDAALPPESSLNGSVTVELQGGPVAVDRLRETLTSAFDVQVSGSASGDQEVDLRLRLTNA
ncbi:hypothetical protein OG585_43800 [Streptomyces sp. NBC_01340]|jgi:hypothetical protein|uniref:hypothetical protein n=1 Tax=unclassified Streptomyces TaxID=2593676 RepID=UPI00225219F6|nr:MULTISPECIES: hypothetical protein [unclassified Streptomyces]MCX4459670.1 hypothetical protein [Streptomyces sp. NBC_01719]MCX4499028.1 hypothetical protein [Streptomyces sp. NBC_01728]WSI43456.1 hypothetical protein OG585_43800 [Streptomyces sp. NBC_01340]